jgi:hypothetical protein
MPDAEKVARNLESNYHINIPDYENAKIILPAASGDNAFM